MGKNFVKNLILKNINQEKLIEIINSMNVLECYVIFFYYFMQMLKKKTNTYIYISNFIWRKMQIFTLNVLIYF